MKSAGSAVGCRSSPRQVGQVGPALQQQVLPIELVFKKRVTYDIISTELGKLLLGILFLAFLGF